MIEQFKEFLCPYCWSSNTVEIDISGGKTQKLLTDCELCCRPIILRIHRDKSNFWEVSAEMENG